ncbi:MAG: diguanylate cyclase [Oscillospiraceae bacterium]|nr:diguanylate cyclase [Oscillospiraceae bacterium]
MKIRTLFILFLTFFSLASMIAYTVYSAGSMNNSAAVQYEQMYKDIAENESKAVSEYLKKLNATASVLTFDTAITFCSVYDKEALNTAMEQAEKYINSSTGIKRIAIMSDDGKPRACTESGYAITFDQEQFWSMTEGEAYISPLLDDNGKTTGEYDLAVPCKLNSGATLLVYFSGYYHGNGSKSDFDVIIKSGNFPGNGHVVFVDSLGGTVDPTYIGNISSITLGDYSTLKSTVLNDSSKLGQSITFEVGKNVRTSYTLQSPGCGWYVSAMAEADKAYTYSSAAFNSLLGLVIGLSLFFIALHIVVNILITKPLSEIEHTLAKIHRGDHDSRINIGSKNEYGQIARQFNNLVNNVVVSERRYRTIVEMADDIVFDWNLKTKNITFSNNFNKKFSYRAPSDHFSDSFFMKGKIHPEDNERYRSDLAKLEQGVDFKDNQYRWKNVYGDYIWMSMKTSTIRDSDGNIIKIIGVLSDVDREKRGELQLIQRASYDALTGVYNRESIENVISSEIMKVSEGGDSFAILFVDVDDFKIYNDKYSHATGDQVLQFVTGSISEIIEEYGFIGRYGGDEFLVCVRNSSTNSPQRVAQDILTKLKNGFVCDTDELLSVSVSIGVYIVSSADKNVDEIISIADDAMYRIKKNGKSSFGVVNDLQ